MLSYTLPLGLLSSIRRVVEMNTLSAPSNRRAHRTRCRLIFHRNRKPWNTEYMWDETNDDCYGVLLRSRGVSLLARSEGYDYGRIRHNTTAELTPKAGIFCGGVLQTTESFIHASEENTDCCRLC